MDQTTTAPPELDEQRQVAPARIVYERALSHDELFAAVRDNLAPIWVPLETALANTSSCFKGVIQSRVASYHDRPHPLAKVFAQVDRVFAVVYFEGVHRDLLLPLDLWVMRRAG